MTVCRKCLLLSDYPGIDFDARGVCRFCREHIVASSALPPREIRQRLEKDFEETLSRLRGEHQYDGLICLSGGKDSVYLAHLLKGKFKLNLLAYHLHNSIIAPSHQASVSRAADRLGLTVITHNWSPEFTRRFYRHIYIHPLREGVGATVCRCCQMAMISSAVRLAQQRDIPLVFIGYAPAQTAEGWVYEIKEEVFSATWRAFGDFWKQPGLAPADRARFYLPGGESGGFPRILMPFHVLEYPSEKEVRRRVEALGLLKRKGPYAAANKCSLFWLNMHCDTLHRGDNQYRARGSEKIRRGEDSRLKWLLGLKLAGWLIRKQRFRRKTIRAVLQMLDLTEGQILESLSKSRQSAAQYHDVYILDPCREILRQRTGQDEGAEAGRTAG